ncbi:MAG: ABC transporter substrate-binding protein [Deltaproteobacteria bacterium]|nr:ABC transporter substrate-binding protein [Deltaproteobacteria bacterium]MBI2180934.1 ABC transporter substrate-binding protein [Deltaproteobacteria bacterium]MBI2363857.1 ABC transporter substrate-binding protein [Deltaproteobacteria bacterium]MBI2532861.1 ABC transporter substrate-binding protein [Deltaproteobacteria bacterium]
MIVKRMTIPALTLLLSVFLRTIDAAEKLIADYGGHAGFQSAMWVAKDLKIFEKHGLDVEVIMITGSARSVAALFGGSTQFATGSATGPLAAAVRGTDIKIIAASYNKFPYAFVVKPDIRTPNDLRGKKINILNFGGSNDLALQLALKEWGMKPSDVQTIIGGDSPTRLGALMAGRMDATILSPPHLTMAVKAGYRILADMGAMSANFAQSTLNVKGSALRDHRDRVKRFVRAYAEAIQRIKTDRESTMKIFAKRMRVEDLETLKSTYDYFAPRFSFPPRVNLEGVRETLKFYAEQNADFKNRNPEDFVDHSIVDELEKEGFFKKLGG